MNAFRPTDPGSHLKHLFCANTVDMLGINICTYVYMIVLRIPASHQQSSPSTYNLIPTQPDKSG